MKKNCSSETQGQENREKHMEGRTSYPERVEPIETGSSSEKNPERQKIMSVKCEECRVITNAAGENIRDYRIGDLKEIEKHSEAPSGTQTPENEIGSLFEKKILVMHNDPEVCYTLKNILEMNGFIYVFAECDATAAIDLAGKILPRIIITHLYQPKMGGAEMIKRLRDNTLEKPPRIIILSPSRNDETSEKLGGLIDAHIINPVGPDELIEKVKKLLSSASGKR